VDSELFVSILLVYCLFRFCVHVSSSGAVLPVLRGVEREFFKVTDLLEIFLLASCVERIC